MTRAVLFAGGGTGGHERSSSNPRIRSSSTFLSPYFTPPAPREDEKDETGSVASRSLPIMKPLENKDQNEISYAFKFSEPPPTPQLSNYARNYGGGNSSVLPQYIQSIIAHQAHVAQTLMRPQHEEKLLKKLSKAIILPEDPSDPSAFTVTPGLTRPPKPPWCSSDPVVKIVGTFAVLMSIGIIVLVLIMNCESCHRIMSLYLLVFFRQTKCTYFSLYMTISTYTVQIHC